MRRKSPLDGLRSEVRKRRGQVTAKENRIKRNTGVDVRGTAADPRRPVNAVERMNTAQLNSYKRELDAFMSRSNGFVAGANNAPIAKSDWLAYKKVEREFNKVGASHFDQIANIFIPVSGMTIAERDKLMMPDNKRAQGEVVHRPYGEVNRKAANVKSADALNKLKAAMEKKLSHDYLPSQIAAGRKQLSQMLEGMGGGDAMQADADALSDSQFNVLWNYTNFATAVSAISESGGHRSKATKAADSSDRYMAGVVEGYSDDIRKFFGWAKTIPENGPKRTASRASKKAAGKTKKPSKGR